MPPPNAAASSADQPPANSPDTGGNPTTAINAPKPLPDGQLDLAAPTIASFADAHNICAGLERQNSTRAVRSGIIQQVYDLAPPRNFGEKLMKAKAWQANFSTGWLAGIVDRNKMRLSSGIVRSPILTHSSVGENFPNNQQVTEALRGMITALYRDWSGFSNFLNAIAGENSLQGYVLPIFLDPWTWKPTFFKQEKTNVPEGSELDASGLQLLSVTYDYPLQTFLRTVFSDPAAAESAGYDIKNCQYAAENAPLASPMKDGSSITNPRALQDMLTQGATGATYGNQGQRVVRTYLLFSVEYDGKVSLWMTNRDADTNAHRGLRHVRGLFASMEAVTAIFSFDSGNTTIHGSKGIGRKLINQALALERTRNQLLDNAFLSSTLAAKH